MNDNYNNMSPEEIDAQRRAEKIRAMKKNLSGSEGETVNESRSVSAPRPLKRVVPVEQRPVDAAVPPVNKEHGKKKKKKKTFGQKVRGLFPEKKDSILERIRKIIFLGSLVAIVVCGYLVSDYYIDLWKSSRVTKELQEIHDIYNKKDFDMEKTVDGKKYYTMMDSMRKLLDMNKDCAAFISIPGTPVNNPVVKGKDNDEYLHKNFYGQESRAGTLFMDWRNKFDIVEDHRLKIENSGNIVIYGHNMNDESMFGCLKYYERNPDYYSEHPLINVDSLYEHYTYKIFAFFIVDADDKSETKFDCWNKLDFENEDEFYEFANEAKKRSLQITNVDVKYGDPIITLSTCQYLLGDRSRLIVMARQVRDGEDPYEGTTSVPNTNIKYPSLYYSSRPNEKYDPDAPFEPYGP